MKRKIAIVVLVSFFHWLCLPFVAAYTVYAQEKEMTGRLVGCDKDTSCYINLGSKDNVKEGMEFDVTRKGKPIGTAKVVKVNKYSSLVTVTASGEEKPGAFDAVSVKAAPSVPVEEKTETKLPEVKLPETSVTETQSPETKEDADEKQKVSLEPKKEEAGAVIKDKEKVTDETKTDSGEVAIAVVPFENSSQYKGKDIEQKAADSLISALQVKGALSGKKVRMIEREKIEEVLKEIKLGMSGYTDAKTAKQVGTQLNADLLVFGRINSVSVLKGMNEAYVNLYVRVVDVSKGDIRFAVSATGGSGKKQGAEEALVDLAVKRASALLMNKIPGEVTSLTTTFSKDSVEINLGEENGLKKNDRLMVTRNDKKIGTIKIVSVELKTSVAVFQPDSPGTAIGENDKILPNVKDDELPKAKGKKNSTLMLIGGALVLGIVLALSGKKKDEGTTAKTVPAPPLPPN